MLSLLGTVVATHGGVRGPFDGLDPGTFTTRVIHVPGFGAL